MKKDKKPDSILLVSILLLIVLGFIILAEVSIAISQRNADNSFFYLIHQILYGFIPGGILGFLAYKIKPEFLKKICLPFLFVILALMLLVILPKIGTLLGGAKRWISIGPISFQPSEFLKLSFIIYLAAWLSRHSKKQKKNQKFKLFLPLIISLGTISALLIAQPDISTLVIIATTTLIMYFSAGTPLYHTAILILAGLGSLGILIKTAPYRLNRFLVFIKPNTQPMGTGYQLKQSLIAIGSGTVLGRGLGLSVQKAGFLPQPMTDMIFAIFAEETGFVGATIFVILFLVFAWQGFKIAKKCSDSFLKLMAIGITFWLVSQAFINMGAITGILPLTGIPLPFVSYGSSHLVVELIAVGILLNISKYAKE
jgi:cell division protein FtsW